MFSQACVILFTGGCLPQCMLGYCTPPGADTPHPADAPLGADTLEEQTHPPGADTPGSRHPLEQTSPPGADTPHPPQEQTPPAQSMLGDTVNARAVRILLECNLVEVCSLLFFMFVVYFQFQSVLRVPMTA